MSFSGLKTAVLRQRDQIIAVHNGLPVQDRADICASFQAAVADVLAEKTRRAIRSLTEITDTPVLAVAGGVAANQTIRQTLLGVCEEFDAEFTAPPLNLCTDNAAMIAYAGIEKFAQGNIDDMRLSARPRWPLDNLSPSLIGGGKKGAKA